VEGDTLAGLRKRTAGGPPPFPIATRILLDALAGLHAAHELRDDDGHLLDVVHRDFTPHNILVGLDGVGRLTDFGIAKAATRLGHTRTGNVKGKVSYMAPEQATGAPLDRRCDVWAAGVIAWETFAGRRLHADDDDFATMLKIVTEPPPRLRAVDPSIDAEVDDVVASALEMEDTRRCPTAAAFAKSLASVCRAHGGVAEPDEVAEWVSRNVGARLTARRAQVFEVRALRAKMGRIADGAVEERPSTPIGHGVEIDRAQPGTPTVLSSMNPLRRRVPLGARMLGIAATIAALVCAVMLSAWRAAATRDDTTASSALPVVTAPATVIATWTATGATRASSEPAPPSQPAATAAATAPTGVAPAARLRPAFTGGGHPSHPPAASAPRPHTAPATPGPLAPSPY
jgi:serine/threonine-protein kinase